jgi:glycosyltransferase involved in cell wall biosynthesis
MKILLVSRYYPNDMSFGGSQRTTLMHRALKTQGDVTTVVLHDGRPMGVVARPRPEVAGEVSYPDPPLLRKYSPVAGIKRLLDTVVDLDAFDLVVGRHLGPLLALPRTRALRIADNDDAYYHYPPGSTPWSALGALAKTKGRVALGRNVMRQLAHTWLCCERDRRLFDLPGTSILPNVTATADVSVESVRDAETTVLMVGALWYQPNKDALNWFLQHAWPAIRERNPGARFRAVGAAPPETRARWQTVPGVECPGFVDSLAEEYKRARVTIALMQSGGGTQIKALESLAHGRVPVVSGFVAGGFAPHLADGQSLYVADRATLVTNRVTQLLQDPASGEALARHGRQTVLDQYSPARFTAAVAQTIHGLKQSIS